MNIEGVMLTPKKIMSNDRGRVMKALQSDDRAFVKFGEAYISEIFPGVTKGWALHTLSTSNIVVPIGEARFVMVDARDGSPTKGQYDDVTLGESNYQMLTVPPGIAYGWRNNSNRSALVFNCASETWSVTESSNVPLETYPFEW